MTVIGLIGPIAAGKGLVAEEFRRRGATIILADEVSRDVVAPGAPALDAVLREFGEEYRRPDGSLDRARMGELVFGDPSARARLERIVHPPMVEALRSRLRGLRESGSVPVAVLEAANLIEMGARGLVDLVVRVDAPPEVRLERLIARDGLSAAEARARIRAQEQMDLGAHPADFVLNNDGSRTELREQVARLWTQITASGVHEK